MAENIANLAVYGLNLAKTNPKKAEEFAKTCLGVGAAIVIVGAVVFAAAKLLS